MDVSVYRIGPTAAGATIGQPDAAGLPPTCLMQGTTGVYPSETTNLMGGYVRMSPNMASVIGYSSGWFETIIECDLLAVLYIQHAAPLDGSLDTTIPTAWNRAGQYANYGPYSLDVTTEWSGHPAYDGSSPLGGAPVAGTASTTWHVPIGTMFQPTCLHQIPDTVIEVNWEFSLVRLEDTIAIPMPCEVPMLFRQRRGEQA